MNMRFVPIENIKNAEERIKTNKTRIMKGFKTVDVKDNNGFFYKSIQIKDSQLKINKDNIGDRVYWSGDSMNKEYHLIDIKEEGEVGYSHGAVTIRESGKMRAIHCYPDEVILHPDNFKRKRKKRKRRKKDNGKH